MDKYPRLAEENIKTYEFNSYQEFNKTFPMAKAWPKFYPCMIREEFWDYYIDYIPEYYVSYDGSGTWESIKSINPLY